MADKSGNNKGDRTPPRIPIPGQSNESPAASPRDKRPRTESENSQESPRSRNLSGGAYPITVAASPPKFVSMDEIMQAAQGVSNLALAHEIAVDSDFSINPAKPPEDSLETKVKDAMHRAFWDILEEKLKEDPPDLSHAVILLAEVKENLMHLLLPQHVSIRQQIHEVLDMEFIEQKADHGALDFHYYAGFVIDLMAKLCAEARDEEVARLRTVKEVVPLYREVFRVLDLLKLDMANFTIQQMRPFIQQQSAQYERAKFDNFLKQQKDNNVDGLQFTKAWLERNKIVLEKKQEEAIQSSDGTTASSGATPKSVTISPTALLHEAYLELLQWDFDNQIFPETVLLDEARFITLAQRVKWLSLVSSTLLVTYNTVGAPLAGIAGFKDKLKEQMAAIMAGVPESQLADGMKNVSAQILKEVQECLSEHSFPQLDATRQDALTKQVEALADTQHPVQKLMRSRIIGFTHSILSRSQPQQSLQIPPGLSTVSKELSETCSAFMRLVTHNQKVFGSHYADIIKALLNKS